MENRLLYERGKRTCRQVLSETGSSSTLAGMTPDSTRGDA